MHRRPRGALAQLGIGGEARAIPVVGTLSGFIIDFTGRSEFFTPPVTSSTCCVSIGPSTFFDVTGRFTYDTDAAITVVPPTPTSGRYLFTHDASLSFTFQLFDGTINTYSTHASPEAPITIGVSGGMVPLPGGGTGRVESTFVIQGTLGDATNPTPHVVPALSLRDDTGIDEAIQSGALPIAPFPNAFSDPRFNLSFEPDQPLAGVAISGLVFLDSLTTVPEPASIGLFGLALVALGLLRARPESRRRTVRPRRP